MVTIAGLTKVEYSAFNQRAQALPKIQKFAIIANAAKRDKITMQKAP